MPGGINGRLLLLREFREQDFTLTFQFSLFGIQVSWWVFDFYFLFFCFQLVWRATFSPHWEILKPWVQLEKTSTLIVCRRCWSSEVFRHHSSAVLDRDSKPCSDVLEVRVVEARNAVSFKCFRRFNGSRINWHLVSFVDNKSNQLIASLKNPDNSVQLAAAAEICQMLVMGNEDTLHGFPIKQAVTALTGVISGEGNYELVRIVFIWSRTMFSWKFVHCDNYTKYFVFRWRNVFERFRPWWILFRDLQQLSLAPSQICWRNFSRSNTSTCLNKRWWRWKCFRDATQSKFYEL